MRKRLSEKNVYAHRTVDNDHIATHTHGIHHTTQQSHISVIFRTGLRALPEVPAGHVLIYRQTHVFKVIV